MRSSRSFPTCLVPVPLLIIRGCRAHDRVCSEEMMDWGGYIQGYQKVRGRRSYVACAGCSSSWIWADRVSPSRWGCNKCGTPWPATEAWNGSPSPTRKVRKPRGRDRTKVEPPPGLGSKQKPEGNALEATLRKAWGTMPTATQDALKGLVLISLRNRSCRHWRRC